MVGLKSVRDLSGTGDHVVVGPRPAELDILKTI